MLQKHPERTPDVEKNSPLAVTPEDVTGPLGQVDESSSEAEGSGRIEEVGPKEQPEPAVAPAAGEEPRQGWFTRLLRYLFGSETRVGRFMRPFLRVAALLVGGIGIGALAAYLLLYQPSQKQIAAGNAAITEREQVIGTLDKALKASQTEVGEARKTIAGMTTELQTTQRRDTLVLVIKDVALARMNLALKDGPKALEALENARTRLATLLPFVTEKDTALATELRSRMETMINVLVRDPQLAQSDLENLYTTLFSAHEKLFGVKP